MKNSDINENMPISKYIEISSNFGTNNYKLRNSRDSKNRAEKYDEKKNSDGI